MHKRLILTALLILSFLPDRGRAAILFQESFETDGLGDRYTVTGGFSDGSDDYFVRAGSGSDPAGLPAYTGMEGHFYWAAEDTETVDNPNLEKSWIDFTDLEIAPGSSLTFSLDVAAGSTTHFDEAEDYLKLLIRPAGGEFDPILAFENDGTANNSSFHPDTDLDGIGEGEQIELAFTTFESMPVAVLTPSFDLRIETWMTSGSEAVAFDNLTVATVPEPALTALLLTFGTIGSLFFRRLSDPGDEPGSPQEAEPK